MSKGSKVIGNMLFINIFLALIKLSGGLIFKSATLISDGVGSLSDLIVSFVSLFGEKFAITKRGKKKFIFEYETSLVVGIIIILLAIVTIIGAFKSEISNASFIVVGFSIFALIIKIVFLKYLLKKAKLLNDPILMANAEDGKVDTITSVFALLIIIVSVFLGHLEIFKYLDKVGGIIISIVILITGVDIIISSKKNIKKLEKN